MSNLKSNMDRFIVQLDGYTTVPYWHLKSNMDRFIERMNIPF